MGVPHQRERLVSDRLPSVHTGSPSSDANASLPWSQPDRDSSHAEYPAESVVPARWPWDGCLGSSDGQNRFNALFRRLISELSSRAHRATHPFRSGAQPHTGGYRRGQALRVQSVPWRHRRHQHLQTQQPSHCWLCGHELAGFLQHRIDDGQPHGALLYCPFQLGISFLRTEEKYQ